MLINEIAEYLDDEGIGIYDPDGDVEDGNIFIERLPDEPETAIALWSRSGSAGDLKVSLGRPSCRVEVRGDTDARTAGELARDIYEALHGQHQIQFITGGTHVYLVQCSNPAHVRTDETGRHVFGFDVNMITDDTIV